MSPRCFLLFSCKAFFSVAAKCQSAFMHILRFYAFVIYEIKADIKSNLLVSKT